MKLLLLGILKLIIKNTKLVILIIIFLGVLYIYIQVFLKGLNTFIIINKARKL